MKKASLLLLLATAILPVLSMANEGAHHEEGGIPWKNIFWQTFNIAVLVGILVFFLRVKVTAYFKTRAEDYQRAFDSARQAKELAEHELAEIKKRLAKLESTEGESLDSAQKDATRFKENMVKEALELSDKVRSDASQTAQVEVEKAKMQLRDFVLNESVVGARKRIGEIAGDADQRRLQKDFVNNLGGVP
jgi:F-type H+-transporting ATPase subunit b